MAPPMDSPGKPPSQVLRDQRRAAPDVSPVATRMRASSPDILVPSSDDPDSSRGDAAVTSTPYNSKYHHNSNPGSGEDPFRTPQHSDSSPDNSLSTPSTAPNSAASASVELFLGPQPLSYIHLRNRILNGEDYNPSPLRPKNADGNAEVPPLMTVASNSNVIERPPQVTLVPSEKVAPDTDAPQLSKWRQEQLKKVKPIRPVAGARERPIPLLHGPLSLPYARNPSGVDATVADQSSYMSHVFGLRVVNSPDGKGATNSSPRVTSEPAGRHSNSASGSYASPSNHHHNDKSNPFSPPNPKQRPMVVRDYNQVIGIKKDVAQEAPDVNHLKMSAYLAQAVDARTQLSLGKPAAPMPSPPDNRVRIPSDSFLPQYPGNQGVDNKTTTLTLVDPLTQQFYTVKVPKSSVADPVIDLNSFDKIHTSTPYSGKADSSINWRNKASRSNQGTPIRNVGSPHSMASSPATTKDSAPQVLTLEHLYEKFANKKVPSKEDMSSFSSPKSSLSKSSTSASVLKALSALNDNTGRKVNVSEAESSTANTSKSSPIKKKRIASGKSRNAASKAEPSSSSPGASPQKGTVGRRSKRAVKSVGT